jgi:peptidyl-tRNA hydrolase, PTH1 family
MLIVGLGNPGDKYRSSRHNAGFMFVERAREYIMSNGGSMSDWRISSTFNADISEGNYNGHTIVLFKPIQYMNRSGEAVSKYLRKKGNIDITKELVLVHDDLDIKLGEYKVQYEKLPKAHNGVNDVVMRIGSRKFLSARIGVDDRENRDIAPEDYVLMRMNQSSMNLLLESIDNAIVELFSQLQK